MYYEDTIVAISTPVGRGGIGIVRMSGRDALAIGDRIFIPRRGCALSRLEPWKLHLGHIVDRTSESTVDEVLAVYMPAPHTYTREDSLEVDCHSGFLVLDRILQIALREGARLAEPGEFTRRAYLNGRIDLSQAEAVLEVVESKTGRALEGAVGRLRGETMEEVSDIRRRIMDELILVEANIDFTEEDLPVRDEGQIAGAVERICMDLEDMVRDGKIERIYSEGILLAIIGAPNVGKSSLFNALLKEDRAIVTEVPGTTSDVIEEYLSIEGIPVRVSDTAGIRKPKRVVEAAGVERSLKAIEEADLILLVVDGSGPPTREDLRLYERVCGRGIVIVANKSDLGVSERMRSWCEGTGSPFVHTSAIKAEGLDELGEEVRGMVVKDSGGDSISCAIGNRRQISLLESGLRDLREAESAASSSEGMEVVAFLLREAIASIDRIRGTGLSEEILDGIFRRFCVGK